MLEGLEISEVKLSKAISITGDCRFDSDYYQKKYINNENLLGNKKTVSLSILCNSIRKGIFDLSPDNYKPAGIPLIRTSEIKDPTINFNSTVFIDSKVHDSNKVTELGSWDLVFTKIGAYIGDVAILPTTYTIYNFSQNVAGASIKEKTISPYLLFFFLSSVGRNQILRSLMLSGQGKLELADIRNYKIPVISEQLKNELARIYREIEEKNQASTNKYMEAELFLLLSLGYDKWLIEDNLYNAKKLSNTLEASGRLDAEYYQQKYDSLFSFLRSAVTKRLGDVTYIQKSIEPGSDLYETEGIPFVRVADITKFGITEPSVYLNPDLFMDVIHPKKDTILLTKDGSVGIAYKVEKDEKYITSGAILHLYVNNDSVLPDYLALVINSKVVQMQAERDAGGSIIQHWKPSEISNVIIPILPIEEQLEISTKVQESFKLRHESKQLVEIAKQTVEIAISENEEKAIKYIKENGESLLGRQI